MNADLSGGLAELGNRLAAVTVAVRDGRGAGAGILWRPGLILTNAHVVHGTHAVVEHRGRNVRARLGRRDVQHDLATLEFPPEAFGAAAASVPVRASASLRPGELVFAFGHPGGTRNALASGTVRRATPSIVVSSVRLAPGNSGGPLADAEGRIVGINSAIANGLALSVPTEAVDALLADGEARRRLGVSLAPVALPRPALLIVGIEPDSEAERSGLALGDAVVAIDGRSVGARTDLRVLQTAASLEVVRAGRVVAIRLSGRASRAA